MKHQESLTSEQRIEIIEQMINTAKGKFTNNSFHFLLWGWVVVIANLSHFYLMSYSEYPHPELIWIISIPAAIASMIYGYRQRKTTTTRGYTDRISLWIWLAYMICIVTVIVFGAKINFMIAPMIMLLTGFATFLSGNIIKFRPLIIGGIIFWLASIAGFMSSYENQALISGAAIALGYLIPGYILKANHNNG